MVKGIKRKEFYDEGRYVLIRPVVSIWAAILQVFGAYH